MPEAAVVLPLVILAIITVVLILMFFYEESVEKSRLHMELRQKAAIEAERVPEEYSSAGSSLYGGSAVLEVSPKGVFSNVSGHVYVRMISRGLLAAAKESRLEDSWHAVSGANFRRLFDYQGIL